MSRMKISGQTQGRLVFAYDIREGHLNYKMLIPAVNRKVISMGLEAIIEEKEVEDILGEILFRVNNICVDRIGDFLDGKGKKIDIEQIAEEVIKELIQK